MPAVNPFVICHKLPIILPEAKSVKKKSRKINAERLQALNVEIDRLLKADFIRETLYPDWLANPILVKKNGKWRVSIDSFSLPNIDQMVDAIASHELPSFMYAYLGYNQIKMHPTDENKTAFTTDCAIYCYKVMPFNQKNVRSTFQPMVNKVFKELIRIQWRCT